MGLGLTFVLSIPEHRVPKISIRVEYFKVELPIVLKLLQKYKDAKSLEQLTEMEYCPTSLWKISQMGISIKTMHLRFKSPNKKRSSRQEMGVDLLTLCFHGTFMVWLHNLKQ